MRKIVLFLIIGITSCSDDFPPKVQTNSIEYVTHTTAILYSEIIENWGYHVDRGAVYATSYRPTIQDNLILTFNNLDSFRTPLSGLSYNTTYYVRAFGENKAGIAYGNELSFTTKAISTYHDTRDDNVYPEVVIGEQIWMGENMRFQIDESLSKPVVSEFTEEDLSKLGLLYHVEVCDAVCPSGWHLPTDEDWKNLERYLGMPEDLIGEQHFRGSHEAYDLREPGIKYWQSDHDSVTNSTGFTALPAGISDANGYNSTFGRYTYFWTAMDDTGTRWNRGLGESNSIYEQGIERTGFVANEVNSINYFISVRCLKDN